jgi:hypothetical protein
MLDFPGVEFHYGKLWITEPNTYKGLSAIWFEFFYNPSRRIYTYGLFYPYVYTQR